MAKLTEKAILQTFDDMIHEMPFEKITVSALVARCGISSNTFYYHYQDIYALVECMAGRQVKEVCPGCLSDGRLEECFEKLCA